MTNDSYGIGFGPGDFDLPDDVYEALEPLDGWPKGSRGGLRPYSYVAPDGRRFVVVIGLSDFGDLYVKEVLDTKPEPIHNHLTRDIKPKGQCPKCDEHWTESPHFDAIPTDFVEIARIPKTKYVIREDNDFIYLFEHDDHGAFS